MSYTCGRVTGHESAAVVALQAIGRQMIRGRPVPYNYLVAVSESNQANYCAIVEILHGAGYVANDHIKEFRVA